MSSLLYKVRGNSPQGKPRVYFCCHKDDFTKYFNEISEEILGMQCCAIWYREDFYAIDEELENDLKQMQLFVIPVTAKFLTTDNQALNYEFKIAVKHHIPILPLMQEPGLEQLFNLKCGELQFLTPHAMDATEISYDEKLKKYLEAVLIGNELSEKIRSAFDAYIFLSYRKKDRKYAQELMNIIHKNDFCRDIAIWYDEFLTPGENFNDSIKEALHKSDLFVMTVTPNLVNELNYVVTTEYPMAIEERKPVLPVELVRTDKKALFNKFEGIPSPTKAHNAKRFSKALLENIKKIVIGEMDNSPEHSYLIGLAYLNGIDVEVNRERAVSLITYAAENQLPEAMKKLSGMCRDGEAVTLDYKKAAYWAEKYYDYCVKKLGEIHPDTLTALSDLALACGAAGDYRKQAGHNYMAYQYRRAILGHDHIDTLASLSNYAVSLARCDDREEALIYGEEAYRRHAEILGEEHPATIQALSNYGFVLSKWRRHNRKNYECYQMVYDLRKKLLGEEHPDTIAALSDLAFSYDFYREYDTRLKILENVYEVRKKLFGEEHPVTITTILDLADCHFKMKHFKEGIELNVKVCELRRKILGEDHIETRKAYENIEFMYKYYERDQVSMDYFDAMYDAKCRLQGELHYDTIRVLYTIAEVYGNRGDDEKKNVYLEMANSQKKKALEHERKKHMFALKFCKLKR